MPPREDSQTAVRLLLEIATYGCTPETQRAAQQFLRSLPTCQTPGCGMPVLATQARTCSRQCRVDRQTMPRVVVARATARLDTPTTTHRLKETTDD